MKTAVSLGAAALLTLAGATLPAYASTTVYSDRTAFAAQLGSSVLDNYENPGYSFFQNDAQMSAVLGETTYTTTGFPNLDFVVPVGSTDHYYCSGCNGTFQLGFASTSVSSGGGVFGAGFDLIVNETYNALVKFDDGSSAIFALPTSPAVLDPNPFWGITSDLGIASIYLGHDGQPGTDGNTGIDNLQIGSARSVAVVAVPEPAAWTLMLAGFGAIGGLLRQRRRAGLVGTIS